MATPICVVPGPLGPWERERPLKYIQILSSRTMREASSTRRLSKEAGLSRLAFRIGLAPCLFQGVAVYLASEESRFHNGDVLVVDGGYAIF